MRVGVGAGAHALARSATPELAGTLVSAPPRRPPGRDRPPHARVRRVTILGPEAGSIKAIAVLARDGRRDVLELLLRPDDGGRWRVAELG